MSENKNKMRLSFAEITQGRNVTIEERLLFEAGYMAGQKAMQERCATSCENFGGFKNGYACASAIRSIGEDDDINNTRD